MPTEFCIWLLVLAIIFLVPANGLQATEEHINLENNMEDQEMERKRDRDKRAANTKFSLTQDERIAFEYWHNFYRANVTNPYPADMYTMYWHSELEAGAQLWAENCYWGHGQATTMTRTMAANSLGQNLYAGAGYPDPSFVVGSWYGEVAYYNYGTKTCQSGKMCGHYTQVVWSETYLVGCGIAFCPVLANTAYTNMWMAACNYWPGGNLVGTSPYEDGPSYGFDQCGDCGTIQLQCNPGTSMHPEWYLCGPDTDCALVTECSVTDLTNCMCDQCYYEGVVLGAQNLQSTCTSGTTTAGAASGSSTIAGAASGSSTIAGAASGSSTIAGAASGSSTITGAVSGSSTTAGAALGSTTTTHNSLNSPSSTTAWSQGPTRPYVYPTSTRMSTVGGISAPTGTPASVQPTTPNGIETTDNSTDAPFNTTTPQNGSMSTLQSNNTATPLLLVMFWLLHTMR